MATISDLLRKLVRGESFSAEETRLLNEGNEVLKTLGIAPQKHSISIPLKRSAIQAKAEGTGAEAIATDVTGLIAPIRNNLVTVQSGATILTGLKGNVKIPVYSGTTSDHKSEVDQADDGSGSFTELGMTPKRMTSYIDVSNLIFIQDTADIEGMLLNDLCSSISDKFESTLFGNLNESPIRPKGLFYETPGLQASASIEMMRDMEKAVTFKDQLLSPHYITNAIGRDILKATPEMGNQPKQILQNSTINDYPALITNHVYSNDADSLCGIVFADWAQLIIGMWGVINIKIDDLSRLHLDETTLSVTSYMDYCWRYTNAYKTAYIKA